MEKYISNDVRAVTREVSGGFDTVTMLTDRSQFTKAVQKALTEKWKGIGLTVEQVSVQDVLYPKNITKSYSEAQAAEVAKQKAQNEQETAKVQAETKKIEASASPSPALDRPLWAASWCPSRAASSTASPRTKTAIPAVSVSTAQNEGRPSQKWAAFLFAKSQRTRGSTISTPSPNSRRRGYSS